jgi:hypothetical protein
MKAATNLIVIPTPHAVGSLNDLRGIRREMVKVYRETRRGQLDTQSAARLVFILREIARTITESELEERLTMLEDEMGVKK